MNFSQSPLNPDTINQRYAPHQYIPQSMVQQIGEVSSYIQDRFKQGIRESTAEVIRAARKHKKHACWAILIGSVLAGLAPFTPAVMAGSSIISILGNFNTDLGKNTIASLVFEFSKQAYEKDNQHYLTEEHLEQFIQRVYPQITQDPVTSKELITLTKATNAIEVMCDELKNNQNDLKFLVNELSSLYEKVRNANANHDVLWLPNEQCRELYHLLGSSLNIQGGKPFISRSPLRSTTTQLSLQVTSLRGELQNLQAEHKEQIRLLNDVLTAVHSIGTCKFPGQCPGAQHANSPTPPKYPPSYEMAAQPPWKMAEAVKSSLDNTVVDMSRSDKQNIIGSYVSDTKSSDLAIQEQRNSTPKVAIKQTHPATINTNFTSQPVLNAVKEEKLDTTFLQTIKSGVTLREKYQKLHTSALAASQTDTSYKTYVADLLNLRLREKPYKLTETYGLTGPNVLVGTDPYLSIKQAHQTLAIPGGIGGPIEIDQNIPKAADLLKIKIDKPAQIQPQRTSYTQPNTECLTAAIPANSQPLTHQSNYQIVAQAEDGEDIHPANFLQGDYHIQNDLGRLMSESNLNKVIGQDNYQSLGIIPIAAAPSSTIQVPRIPSNQNILPPSSKDKENNKHKA